ncbi:MAG: VWA domain-containing protein [Chitinophagaceae bacterium]|nr:VWA domain-containing protein [Chitinophagaceae bacterium]
MNLRCLLLIALFAFAAKADAQYYFRGQVKDANDVSLSLVRIHVYSTNSFYYSGSGGNFGIPSARLTDTVSFLLNGYEEKTLVLNSKEFNQVLLKITSANSRPKRKLLSFTKDKELDRNKWSGVSGETYSEQTENEFNFTQQYPATGFAMNVDRASYSNIRRFINMQSAVPPHAVRIEEMLNYFPQAYTPPAAGKTFHVQSQLTDCPWNNASKLLILQLHAKKIVYDHLPPSNFVFLVDVSGSMDLPSRLPLLKTAFRMMVQNLRTVDTISMVVYGGTVAVVLQPTSGREKEKIMDVIDSLAAGGDTPGESAIRQAYSLAQSQFIKGGNNRIILATDGDFNVGEVSEEALMQLITQKQQTGIYLTCLGVGMGNYKDSKLEVLAKKGNGNFAYLDNVMEAEKVLVKELMQTLYAVADDAYLNVSFQSRYVKKYRLIGFDNRTDALSDSTSTLEGGEIGTGHIVTAMFEVQLTDIAMPPDEVIATAELSYLPGDLQQKLTEQYNLPNNYQTLTETGSSYRFASAVATFGLLLKRSAYVKDAGWDDLIRLVQSSANTKDYWQNEMITLVQKAKLIYKPQRQKRSLLNKRKRE